MNNEKYLILDLSDCRDFLKRVDRINHLPYSLNMVENNLSDLGYYLDELRPSILDSRIEELGEMNNIVSERINNLLMGIECSKKVVITHKTPFLFVISIYEV